jgi:hypothetical protein
LAVGTGLQYQAAPIHHRQPEDLLQVLDLAGGEIVVEDDEIGLHRLHRFPQLGRLAPTDKGARIG